MVGIRAKNQAAPEGAAGLIEQGFSPSWAGRTG